MKMAQSSLGVRTWLWVCGSAAAVAAGCSDNQDNGMTLGGAGAGGADNGAMPSATTGGVTAAPTTGVPAAGSPGAGVAGAGVGDQPVTTPVTFAPPAQPVMDGATIPKYVDDLPTFDTRRIDGTQPVAVNMMEFQQPILPQSVYDSLAAPFNAGTYQWGYQINGGTPSFPSVTIQAQQGTPTVVTYSNGLVNDASPLFLEQRLIADLSVHSADPVNLVNDLRCLSEPPLPAECLSPYRAPVPTVAHLHGAEVLSDFDGMPDTWFTAGNAITGPAYVSNVYTYPNTQEATTLWFHDHALGMTRLHVYAGLAGFYLIRDANDTGLAGNPMNLPAGPYETELFVADRQFDAFGQLYFPAGLPGSGPGFNGGPPNPDHHPFWIPEFFGDVITVNGKSWPVMHVEPRRYRMRFVNGSNARFYQMQLFVADPTDTPTATAGPPIWQIGSDGGFLDTPANLELNAIPGVFIAPAERADVIVDFTGLAGQSFILTNGQGCDVNPDSCGAIGPFPSGDPPDPNTSGQVMKVLVDLPLNGVDTSFDPAAVGATVRGGVAQPPAIVDIKPLAAAAAEDTHRQLVLIELEAQGGPEEVLLNNSEWDGNRENLIPGAVPQPIADSVTNGFGVMATEVPQVGSVETWEIANLTEDAHPIHIHLIQFQLINREAMVVGADGGDTIYRTDYDTMFPGGTFNGETFAAGAFIPGYGPPLNYATPNADGALGGNLAFGSPTYLTGTITPPDPNEVGWKDTVKMLPKTVTRVAIRFAPQDVPATGAGAAAPGVNLFPFDPTAPGPGYVWHCHILDHEDNEMMRPYLLRP